MPTKSASKTITRDPDWLGPAIPPGEMLLEEFLVPLDLSANRLARVLGIPTNRITEIVNNRRRITADTALRLGLYFGNSPEFWLNLQTLYELRLARAEVGDHVQILPKLTDRKRRSKAAQALR